MTPGKPFSLHTRKTRKTGKAVYYVQFRLPDGSWSTAQCTGQTSRNAAEGWAYQFLKEPHFFPNANVTFEDYARNFFDFNGPWAREKRITGERLSEKWCVKRQRYTELYLFPAFGSLKLTAIHKHTIDAFRNGLFYEKGLAGSTVNHILSGLRLILAHAEESGLIPAIPTIKAVRGVALRPRREKGILTIEEAQRLFFCVSWPNYTSYVFNLAACLTGARRGELMALQLKNIQPGYIEIHKTWDAEFSRLTETTKNGKPRNIVITDRLESAIMRLAAMNPYGAPDSFLFFSPDLPDKPLNHKVIEKYFFRALAAMGIDETERKRRNISTHSHRHFCNTVMINARLPLQMIQATTGHLDARMTELYYHARPDDMEGVREVQESLFPRIGENHEDPAPQLYGADGGRYETSSKKSSD
jgi:integrase